MNYLLTCPICNTNLKDFKFEEYNYTAFYCKCRPTDKYSKCSGIFIFDRFKQIDIDFCFKHTKYLFKPDNTLQIYSIAGTYFKPLMFNIEHLPSERLKNNFSLNLENIDEFCLIINKIEKNLIFT
jgi:hypothetical protein